MDQDFKEALDALEALHAALWVHFDPSLDRGDKDQPKAVKKALTEARQFARRYGKVFDGWDR